jgi:outer membrane protein assembly factor BamE
MAKRLVSLLLSLTLLQTGCAIHSLRVDQGILIDKENLSYLQEGLTQDQVRKIIGPPANISSFQPLRWEYVFNSTEENFAKDKVKKLVLNFDPQGYLQTWTAIE